MSAAADAKSELETLRIIGAHAGLTADASERFDKALTVIRGWLDRAKGANGHDKAQPEVLPLVLLWFATLNGTKHQHQLVKGLLVAGSLFVVYGESNSGKTFFLLDLGLTIAAGLAWRGRRTRRGLVIYVAGEGSASVRARVAAWRVAHPEISANLPFAIVPQAVDFLSGPSIDQLILTIRAAESECGESAVLIIVDTFARAIPGGNENDALDVGIAVAGADRVRTETGAAVGFVHHAG
jgi:RecA-family ATPase